ncbi:MAG: GH25 family lysozyme [Pseudonocardiaceae bacterium]
MTTARGIDVSSWQHPGEEPIDWAAVKADGYDFVIIKATQGVGYVNPFFGGPSSHDAVDAHDAGLLVGAYHFAQPGALDAEAELRYFLNVVSGHQLDMGLWLDLEDLQGKQPHELVVYAETFLTGLAAVNPVSGLYTDKSLLQGLMGVPGGGKLWLANPTPEPGDPPSFITQTGTGPVAGIKVAVDCDTLNNVRPVNPGPTPAPPAPPATPAQPVPPVPPAPPAPSEPTGGDVQVPTLSEQDPGPGTVNEASRAVQALLVGKAGIGVGPAGIDGRYGNQTQLAVRSYQGRNGLAQDGICGPITWEHLCTS